MGLIDTEQFRKKFFELEIEFRPSQIDAVFECLESSELVDAEPAIRCKDCKHRDWDTIDVPYGQTKRIEWCSIRYNADGENVETTPNDFCSKAERKEK